MYYFGNYGSQFFYWPMIGGLMMIVFWGVVIYFVVIGVQKLTSQNSGRVSRRASEILKERYAKGEIGREEYEKMKKYLDK